MNTVHKSNTLAWVIRSLIVCGTIVGDAHADVLSDALAQGHAYADLRYRMESVSQDNSLKDARASTARLQAGYESGAIDGFFANAGVQSVGVVGQDFYNSTRNGLSSYATVADPATTEVDQLFLGYRGLPDTQFRYGRQRLQLDNERYIGNVGWRQIEQTFDATSMVNQSIPHTTITAAYLYRVHRVFGDAAGTPPGVFQSRSPLLNIAYTGLAHNKLVAYSYLIDLQNIAPTQLPAYPSTRNNGLRLTGSTGLGAQGITLNYTAETALQSNGLQSPQHFLLHYSHYQLDLKDGGYQWTLAREQLGSNGQQAFQTPLATLHAFNGWADMFLQTPVNGLIDQYTALSATVAQAPISIIYHDFRADQGDVRYGTEIDAQATYSLTKHYTVGAALGAYHSINTLKATSYAPATPSTTKGWIWVEAKI